MEYATLRMGVGLWDVTFLGCLRLVGADRAAFLHRLLTNDLTRLAPGHGCRAALVTPEAKLLSDLFVLAEPEAHWLLMDAARIDTARTTLERYHITEDVHLEDVTPRTVAIGLSGPPLRGSGVAKDVRKDEPYAAYDELKFEVPIGTNGDTYDRYLVRLEEFRQSIKIIRQAMEGLPEGPIVGKVPRLIRPTAGETYHAIESPKGELGYFIVSDGKSTNPYRFRVRPPSFCNLQALPQLIKGHLVADVVALIGSIDVVLGEVDR